MHVITRFCQLRHQLSGNLIECMLVVGRKNSIRTLLGDEYAKNWDILVAIDTRKIVTLLSQ